VSAIGACGEGDGERPSSFGSPTTGGQREVPALGGRAGGGGSTGGDGTGEAGAPFAEGGAAEPAGGTSGGAPPAQGGTVNEGGVIGEAGGERALDPFETPPLCPPAEAWAEGTRLELSGEDDDLLAAVTPDELTVLWWSGEQLVHAERPSADEPFGEGTEIDTTGFTSFTVSPDGLRLVATRDSNQAFAEFQREARDQPFDGEADEQAFADLNYALSSIPISRRLGDPLLAGEGERLVFSYYDPEPDAMWTIRESLEPWSIGVPLGGEMLIAVAGKRRVATGMGSDLRTLFYWDEVEEEQRAAERAEPGGTFDRFYSLGQWRGATPNTACDRLYYSAEGPDGDLDLFVSSAE
jgi:hypothetical protein